MCEKTPKILIVVDVQKGFLTDESEHLLVPLAAIQEEFDHAIFTKFHNPKPSPFRRILDYQKLTTGSRSTDLALTPREDAVIIERPLYTCVTPQLLKYLRKLKAREAYVCGIATEACVFKTVLDLFEQDIRPLVLKDLCASDQKKRYHDMAVELMEKLVGGDNVITYAQMRKS